MTRRSSPVASIPPKCADVEERVAEPMQDGLDGFLGVLLAVFLDLLGLSPLLLNRLDHVSCRHQDAARCLVAQHFPYQVGILLDDVTDLSLEARRTDHAVAEDILPRVVETHRVAVRVRVADFDDQFDKSAS